MQVTHDPMNRVTRIEAALAKLGNSPEQARSVIRDAGCQGQRTAPQSCPLHRFIKKETGHGTEVYCDQVAVSVPAGHGWSHTVWIDLPDSISHFVEAFDNGEYPELIQE